MSRDAIGIVLMVLMFAAAVGGVLQASAGVAYADCLQDCAEAYVDCRNAGGCVECENAFQECSLGCGVNPGQGICL